MSDRREFRDLASASALRETVADLDVDAGTETVPLDEARGRVLAERVDAPIDVPGFDRAAMDGYAVGAADTVGASGSAPATLDLAGSVHAGAEPDVEVSAGTAVEISTGAVLPPGADAVVMVEETSEIDDTDGSDETDETADADPSGAAVEIRTAVAPGDHVMPAGADVAAGQRALGPGTRLTPRECGLLAAVGVDSVPVVANPTVGVISTGDELAAPGAELDHAAGQIYDVNGVTVTAAVAEAGGDSVRYPTVGDDPDEMERVLREAAGECDLVCTSGSTSASAMDVVYRVVEDEGELLLHGAAVKPGKPTVVGRIDGTAFVGLPGYPVSALTIFRTFVAPAVRSAAGLPEPATATVDARMAVRERFDEGRRRLLPVGLVDDGGGATLAYPVDRGSGATTTLVDADGVVAVPADTAYLSPDETVTVDLFSASVEPPTVLVVGEDDPLLSRVLDGVDRPRFLARGSRGGSRWLRDGVADVAVVAGPVDVDAETTTLGGWTREWGLVVPSGNPDDVSGLADLVDGDRSFVNRDDSSGLRASLDAALGDLAAERGASLADLAGSIRGYDLTTRAHESPARRVARGDADAGLGLRATAARLGLGFVPVDAEPVRVLAAPERAGKPGVESLAAALAEPGDAPGDLAGFEGQ